MSPDVSIIVVSFNTRGMTLECLRSIYDQTRRTNFEVIVVDNASIDGSADAIAAAFPGVTLVRLPSNVGFAVANNLAASHHARGQYLLLLNPDTQVLDGAVDTLVDFAKANPGAGIWGGRTLNADRSLNPGSCWRQMTLLSLLCSATGLTRLFPSSPILSSESYGGWKRDSVREVDIVTGCLLLITRRLWNELDGFDPAFFMYGEEADLCLRAAACGARPMITPDASIIHCSNTSDVVHPEKMVGILDDARLRDEVAESRHLLEQAVGNNVTLFAFPYGAYDDRVVDACRTAGYTRVFGIDPRVAAIDGSDYVRGRIDVELSDGALEFFLKIHGAYAWMVHAFALKRWFVGPSFG